MIIMLLPRRGGAQVIEHNDLLQKCKRNPDKRFRVAFVAGEQAMITYLCYSSAQKIFDWSPAYFGVKTLGDMLVEVAKVV